MTLNRRKVLQAGAAAATGVLLPRAKTRSADSDWLNVLCWAGYANLNLAGPFTDQTGIYVRWIDPFQNEDFALLLRAGGTERHDLVSPQQGMVQSLAEEGLIRPLDLGRIPNAATLLEPFRDFPWAMHNGQVYAVPFLFGTSPMLWNAATLDDAPTDWEVLEDRRFRRSIAFLDDGPGTIKVWNRARGLPDPTRVTVEELRQTVNELISLKQRNGAGLYVGVPELVTALATGVASVSTGGWESGPTLIEAQDAPIRTAYPDPGTWTFVDCWAIPSAARQVDGAYAYINHVLSAEMQVSAMSAMMRGTVQRDAVERLPGEIAALYPYGDLDGFFDRNPILGYPPFNDLGDDTATHLDWVKEWERFRNAPFDK